MARVHYRWTGPHVDSHSERLAYLVFCSTLFHRSLDVKGDTVIARTATAIPSAISSFVFASRAFEALAAWAIPAKAFMMAGAPLRRSRRRVFNSVVSCGQLFIDLPVAYL